jgi:hypothetical protein
MLGTPRREPELDTNVATIDLPKGCQGIAKDGWNRFDVLWRVEAQDADERQVSGVLRECRNRIAKPEHEDQQMTASHR